MSLGRQILLVGGFIEIVELCQAAEVEIVGIIDGRLSGSPWGLDVLGDDDGAAGILARFPGVPVHITPDQPALRQRLTDRYDALGATVATLVHPHAHVSCSAVLGAGCVVQAGASVSSGARLGRGVKVNTGAVVTHDVTVGDFASIAPGAVLLGRSIVGERCYVGGNATVLPNRMLGAGGVVGAGAVVTRDVPAGATVYGNPARAP